MGRLKTRSADETSNLRPERNTKTVADVNGDTDVNKNTVRGLYFLYLSFADLFRRATNPTQERFPMMSSEFRGVRLRLRL